MTIRQHTMIGAMLDQRGTSIEAALKFDQRIFGSLCHNRWVDFDAKRHAFVVTEKAANLHRLLRQWSGFRIVNTGRFASAVHLRRDNVVVFHHRRRMAA